jgi:hypothetical protein
MPLFLEVIGQIPHQHLDAVLAKMIADFNG